MTKLISEQARNAFYANKNFKKSNTEVRADCTGTYMYLFGNLIAKKCGERVAVSLAGWNSSTTKERLRTLGARISQKKGIPYLTTQEDTFIMNLNEFYQI